MTIVDHSHPVQTDPLSSAETPTPPCLDPLSRWVLAALGALFLFVTFVQAPGLIIDDTKLPVVMAPLSWMQSALHLWNPTLASGSVQSETSGYLFPMAPFFELMHLLHMPVWCAERIWLAALLTVGAWGVIRLTEALGIGKPWARVLGGIAYCVAPLVVDWATVSVDLLAIVLLPWLLQPLVVGSREGSPRRAAAKSGVALAFMGGVNATVIVSTLPLAVIWFLTRAPGPRRRSLLGWWVLAVVLACFWWGVPTLLQGKYGYNYLPYTETSKVTTSTGSAFEALRGASFWQNYDDLGGPLVPGGWTLVTSSAAIVGTSLVTALGLAGLTRRIPERLFLVASLSFGVVVITIGYAAGLGSSPFASLVIRALAGPLGPLRNVSKFSPDVALPLALGLTWFVSTVSIDGIGERLFHYQGRRLSRPLVGVVAVVAVVLAAMPFWQRELYPSGGFSAIPHYWQLAANYLDDHQGNQTSLIVPGANFAEYTWGKPEDEPLAVLASTSVTVRSIIPLGSDGNTIMLSTVEHALATGSAQPGLAQYLARSGIDYVVERNDLDLRQTGAIPPAQVHQVLSETPGLVEVASFGPYLPMSQVAEGRLPVYDSSSSLHLRPVEIFKVDPSVSEVQTFPAKNPLVVSGDSGSLLPLAGAGVLQGRAAVLADDPNKADAVSRSGATWVITDGNQRRAVAFGRIDNNVSYLLGGGERLPGLAPGTPLTYGQTSKAKTETVAAPLGAGSVLASSYGSNPYENDLSEGPASAFDGDPSTAWVGAASKGSAGQWVRITFVHPIKMSRVGITPLNTPRRPTITQIAVQTDNGSVIRSIPSDSKTVWVTVVPGMTRNLKIIIRKVRQTNRPTYPPLGAGITNVSIPGVSFHPAMRLPIDELAQFSSPTREPVILNLDDPVTNPNLDFTGPTTASEPIPRRLALPRATSVGLVGTAVPLPSASLESLLSQVATPPSQTLQISASSWLRDLPRFRPDNLIETSSLPWIAGLSDPEPSLTLRWKGMRSVGSLSLGLTPSASRPTLVTISSPAGSRQVTVPRGGGVVSFTPMSTDSLTVRFVTIAKQVGRVPTGPLTVGLPAPPLITLPVGLSSIGIPALARQVPTPPTSVTPLHLACGAGPTVQVDRTSVRTSVTGTISDLVDLRPLEISACSPSTISLAAGAHIISFPSGGPFRATGLTLQSPPSTVPSTGAADQRSARVVSWTAASRTVSVGAGPATYLQVADNFDTGWVATLHGRTLTPVRLDGWEQGWIVPAGSGGTVAMIFTPDHTYRISLLLGGLFLLLLAILALWGPNRSQLQPIGRRRKFSMVVLAVGAAFAAVCAGGPLVLLLIPLAAVAYRWGDKAVAVIAGLAFMVAGVIVAWHPYTSAGAHKGAFGSAAQFFSVLAFCAVLSAVVMEGHRRPSGRQPAPTPEGDTTGNP